MIIEGAGSTRIRFGAGCSGGRRAGGISSSSLNVKSTTCGGPRLREGVDGDGRTEVDDVLGCGGGSDAGVGAPVSSSSSSRDTISAFGGPNESLRSEERRLSSGVRRGRAEGCWLLRSLASG